MKHSLSMGAAAAPFAHLLGGLGRKSAGRRAEDDKPERDEDDDAKKGARAEEDDDKKDDDDKDGKKGRRAEDDDDDAKKGARAEDDDDDEKDDKDKDGKKSRRGAKDDDETCAEEDDDDDDVSAAARSGRRAERARCRNIFSSKAAGLRPDVAAQLAFGTTLSSAEAIGVLEAAAAGGPAPQGRRIDERMANVRTPPVGPDGGQATAQTGPKAAANAIVGAMNKALGRSN